MNRLSSAVLVAVALGAGSAAAQRQELSARVDSIVTAALRIGGMSVAVVWGRDTVTMKGYGLADVENDIPATAQTMFRVGSVTKQFTAAAVMQLVEHGRLSLDDDITTFVPNAPVHGRRILVRQLLNHTSGIPSYTDVPEFDRVARLDLSHDSLLATIAPDSLLFEPGSHFYYNNTGYYLLGMTIEKIVGQPCAEAIATQLFTPLGLAGTAYCSPSAIIKHRAQGYGVRRGQPVNAEYTSIDLAFAAGALCSTAGDLVKWTNALSSGRVVSGASYTRMTTPVELPSGRKMTYGFGLEAGQLDSHRMISHGGAINGFSAHLAYFPGDSLTVVVLANSSAPTGAIALNIARAAFGLPLQVGPALPKQMATPPALRAKLVGAYLLMQPDGSWVSATITQQDDMLQLQIEKGPPRPLLYQGEATFAIAGMGPARVYFDVAGAIATGFQLDAGSRPLEAVRH